MKSVVVSAPAKINFTLDICGVNDMGYHELDMLMHRIALYDAVYISRIGGEGISLSANKYWLPTDRRNTAFKAAELFLGLIKEKGIACAGGVKIFIKKNIPAGAGLAGGSADGAAVLSGLNRLYGGILSREELLSLALKVGSDVPFMLEGVFSRARGIGEKLESLTPVSEWLLLVTGKRDSASTKEVYAKFDEIGSVQKPKTEEFLASLTERDYDGMRACGGNALTEAACAVAKGISGNLEKMKNAGALFYSMTGSGSVVYGVFPSKKSAEDAEKHFDGNVWKFVCPTAGKGLTISELT